MQINQIGSTVKNLKFSSAMLWGLTVFFFAYQFVLRLSPGVLVEEIMGYYQIDIPTFSYLASFYYLGYAGMQVPIGMLLDKFGVRYVVSSCILICVLGNGLFVLSDHWIFALIGRFLVGFGSAAGALGAIKAVRVNFSHENISKMIGWTVTAGLLGAIYGGKINLFLIDMFGWERAILYLNIPGIIAAIMIIVFIRDTKHKEAEILSEKQSVVKSLVDILKNKRILLLGLFGALLVGPLEAFADIWGNPYFVKVYGFSREDASYLATSAIYFGMCVGSPVLAWIVDRYQAHYTANIACGVIMAAIYYVLLNKMVSGYYTIFAMTFTIGVMCAYQVIVFAVATELVPAKISGIAIAVINMINMAAGSAFHSGIGKLMASYWTGKYEDGIKVYSEAAYTDSLYILPITLILGSIGFFFLKPKRGIC